MNLKPNRPIKQSGVQRPLYSDPSSPAGRHRRHSTTTMAAAAATTSAAEAVTLSRPSLLFQPTSNATFVSFPRRPHPATTLALSAPSQLSLVPAANPKYHNAKVDAGDDEVQGEDLLRRFNWQVSRAGVMEEIRRRRRHEDARDKRKRKARSAARRFRRRRFKGPYPFGDDQGAKEQTTDDENDNWELPGGELPSYR